MPKKTRKQPTKSDTDLPESSANHSVDVMKSEDFTNSNSKKEVKSSEQNRASKVPENSQIAFSENEDEIDDSGWLCL